MQNTAFDPKSLFFGKLWRNFLFWQWINLKAKLDGEFRPRTKFETSMQKGCVAHLVPN